MFVESELPLSRLKGIVSGFHRLFLFRSIQNGRRLTAEVQRPCLDEIERMTESLRGGVRCSAMLARPIEPPYPFRAGCVHRLGSVRRPSISPPAFSKPALGTQGAP